MLLSTKWYTWGKDFYLCTYMMRDSKLAFTTHGKVSVVILDKTVMQSLQPQKQDSQNLRSY